MLRVPIWSMSACSATTATSRASTTSVTTGSPVASRDLGEDLQAGDAQALEGVRRGARLVGAAAQDRGAGGLGHLRGLERLVPGLDGARPGDEGEGVGADRHLVAGLPTQTVERSGWCWRLTSL